MNFYMDNDWKWNKKKNIPIFFRFLKNKNAYSQYLANATNQAIAFYTQGGIIHGLHISCLDDYIDTFSWSQSPEGSDFWCVLDERWRKFCDSSEDDEDDVSDDDNDNWDTIPMYE